MRRLVLLACLLAATVCLAADPADDFEGAWLGEITAPNTSTTLGLAFTRTERGLLVSLYLPEMFLYNVNFGPASIRDGSFTLAPLNLIVSRRGDTLAGTFAPGKFPVVLRRAAAFAPEPPAPDLPAAPAPAWTAPLGAPAWASPVTRDGTLYVGTTDGKFHAVDAATGHPRWTWTGPHPLHGEALATDDAVFFVDDQLDLVCLARATGAFRWRTPLHDAKLAGGPPPANETFNHRAVAPVIDPKGILYVGSTDGGLYALRARNGSVLWRHDAKTKIYAPVLLRGDEVVFAGFDGSVVALHRRTHRESLRVKLGGPIVSAPVLAGNRLIVGCRDYLLYGLDAANGSVAWRDTYWFSWVESTPRLADGVLYVGGSDYRRVSALNPADGHALWATDVRGLSWGTPVVTATSVYAATAGQAIEGTVIQHTGGVIALDRRTGAVRWRYTASVPPGAEFTGFASSLVLAGDLIIGAGVDGTLIAFRAE